MHCFFVYVDNAFVLLLKASRDAWLLDFRLFLLFEVHVILTIIDAFVLSFKCLLVLIIVAQPEMLSQAGLVQVLLVASKQELKLESACQIINLANLPIKDALVVLSFLL